MDSKELMAGKLVAHMLENDIRALRTENAALKEQVAQQAAVIEQMREAFRVASMDTETINRKAPEIAKGCCSMPMPDTAGMYHLANEEVCNVVSSYLYWLHKNQPTALHPSPEILKQRDTMVICEFLERSGKWVVNDAIIAENARKAIQRDLEDAFKRDDEARADSNDYKPLGHACDRAQWE